MAAQPTPSCTDWIFIWDMYILHFQTQCTSQPESVVSCYHCDHPPYWWGWELWSTQWQLQGGPLSRTQGDFVW